jgi:5-(carboxyamino)imidazole ribonucleotide mutase
MSDVPDESEEAVPPVAVVMGSDSDYPTMEGAVEVLDELGVPSEVLVLSAHRMPDEMLQFGHDAAERGFRVIIAGAGGAAHLPGMLASVTRLPVIGVPVPLRNLDGLDSLLSIVQMPRGVPVATVAIGNAANAGLLAARILGLSDEELATRVDDHRRGLADQARAKNDELQRRRDGGRSIGFGRP